MASDKWIQKATDKMKKAGTVGSFSKAAKKAKMSTAAFANKELSPKSKASPAMKAKANFARNVSGK